MAGTNDDREGLKAITTKAAVDREFRARLLKDPKAAIQEAFHRAAPAGVKLKFIEKDPNVDVMVVLPDLVLEDQELTAEELEAVAGGECKIASCWNSGGAAA